LRYEVNEGTLSAIFESTLTVFGEPVETPPRPRSPAGPGYVFSPSIVPPGNPQIGEQVTIIGSFNYELDIPSDRCSRDVQQPLSCRWPTADVRDWQWNGKFS
jgi:hypothetical protein